MPGFSSREVIWPCDRAAPTKTHADGTVEQITKLPYRMGIDLSGHAKRVPLSNAPVIRDTENKYGLNVQKWLSKRGVIWVDACPVQTGQLSVAEARKLFGDDLAVPCMGAFTEDEWCVHVTGIRDLRRKRHEARTTHNAERSKSLEQSLKDMFIDMAKQKAVEETPTRARRKRIQPESD